MADKGKIVINNKDISNPIHERTNLGLGLSQQRSVLICQFIIIF